MHNSIHIGLFDAVKDHLSKDASVDCKETTSTSKPAEQNAQLRNLLQQARDGAAGVPKVPNRKDAVAYLVLVKEGDAATLPRLLGTLYRPQDSYWIHFDANMHSKTVAEIKKHAIMNQPNVQSEQVLAGCWACPSLAWVKMLGLVRLLQSGTGWSHVMTISSNLFPTRPLNEFYDMLSEHPQTMFMYNRKLDTVNGRHNHMWEQRHDNGHDMLCHLGPRTVESLVAAPKSMWKSSQWDILPWAAARWLVLESPVIDQMEFWNSTAIPDEHMVPTLLGNSPWQQEGWSYHWPLTKVNWKPHESGDKPPSPEEFTLKDLDVLRSERTFFGCKISDPALLSALESINPLHPLVSGA
uniref:protein xylosyltransferase n=1 Tax=Eutreptiella gymnastica TaxID=73025 RepID=A0A7S1IYU6_9EUGL|mmetsp:Transcript_52117/g.92906  ORF Transcript_52117/g.92906 Transcript_52117/m.92906 type:complete len:353 (+) Transcript_52117:185-1243(+)